MLDQYINMEVWLAKGEDSDLLICLFRLHNDNPILNTLLYDVLFEDESVESYEANVIAENIWWSVVNNGHYEDYLQRIIDHRINYIVSYVWLWL